MLPRFFSIDSPVTLSVPDIVIFDSSVGKVARCGAVGIIASSKARPKFPLLDGIFEICQDTVLLVAS